MSSLTASVNSVNLFSPFITVHQLRYHPCYLLSLFYHVFNSERYLKEDVKKFGKFQKLPISGNFTTTYKCEYLLNETRYKHTEIRLVNRRVPYISSKFGEHQLSQTDQITEISPSVPEQNMS